jgi:deoxyribonuclease-1
MKTMLALCLLITSLDSFADLTYYPQSTLVKFQDEKATSSDLKNEIFNLSDKFHVVNEDSNDILVDVCPIDTKCTSQRRDQTYTEARKIMFGNLFLETLGAGKYTVKEVYCNIVIDETKGVGPNKIPSGNFINCEHTWPQSKFSKDFSTELQKSDLHHLFPSDMRANSTRSNNPFANVDGQATHSQCQDSKIGFALDNPSIRSFEPPTEHKGNVARAIYYFSTRYKISIDATQAKYLKIWNEEDPVDKEELERNESIMKLQGNRNPFIDYPELISRM